MPGCLVRAPDTMQVAIFGPKVLSPEMLVTLTHSSLSLGTAQAPREVTVSPTCSAPALPSSRVGMGPDPWSVWFLSIQSFSSFENFLLLNVPLSLLKLPLSRCWAQRPN